MKVGLMTVITFNIVGALKLAPLSFGGQVQLSVVADNLALSLIRLAEPFRVQKSR
jgi:hypothetical protein